MYENESIFNKISDNVVTLVEPNRQSLKSQYLLFDSINKVGSKISNLYTSVMNVARNNEDNVEAITTGMRKLQQSADTSNYYNRIAADNSTTMVNYERYDSLQKNGRIVY